MKELIHCIEDSKVKGLELINNYQKYRDDVNCLTTLQEFIIVGSGSSYNAALLAKSFIENELNIKVTLYYPNDFLNYTNYSLVSKQSTIIFISQSGQTKLVVEAAKRMNELGIETIAVTEDSVSELSKKTSLSLDTNTGIEAYMYRTIGVTNTILSLILFALAFAEKTGQVKKEQSTRYLEDLDNIFNTFDEVIKFSTEWYQENKISLKDAKSILFSGAGSYWPVAKEADIKFMEMLPLLTNSFELEEFIHGPQNMFIEEYLFFLIADIDTDLDKALDIKKFLEIEVKAKTFLISGEKYKIFKCESQFKFFLYLVFFQVIAYETSKERGRNLKQGIYPSVSDYVKKSI